MLVDNNDGFFDDNQSVKWWNSYTKLYMQEIFCIDPRTKNACLYFRPQFVDTKKFYQTCSLKILEMITRVQLHLLVDSCRVYHDFGRRPSSILFKIEARVIPLVIGHLLEILDELRVQRIEIILDINSAENISNEIYKNIYCVVDRGYRVCMGGYDWRNNSPEMIRIPHDAFSFLRIGSPPKNTAEVNHFIDSCFYAKEMYGLKLIIDKIQSKTELDIVCNAPYYALMGEYLSPVILVKDYDNEYLKVST